MQGENHEKKMKRKLASVRCTSADFEKNQNRQRTTGAVTMKDSRSPTLRLSNPKVTLASEASVDVDRVVR